MNPFLNLFLVCLSVLLPLAGQTPSQKSNIRTITLETDLPKMSCIHGQGREVPQDVIFLKGVVPYQSETFPKVYAFTLAPNEAIRVRVVECTPKQVYLAEGNSLNAMKPKERAYTPHLGYINKSNDSYRFFVLVMDHDWESQFTLAIDRWISATNSK